MRCINKKRQITALLLAACLTASLTSGCGQTAQLTDAFSSDRPEYGIQSGDDNTEIPYFAKDLCVAEGDAEEIEADTSEAGAALFFNIDTKEVLYAKNIYERLYPASTTKLMTALVALKNGDLDAQTTVSQESVTFHESGVSTAKLKAGDVLTLRQLLYALLLPSANDAANVIAEQIAGSQDQFVAMMNAEAKEIGATGSHFVNANGLHDENHYTTAYDLYLIFQAAMQYDDFMEIIQQKEYTATYTASDGSAIEATWSSSNKFTSGAVTVPDGVQAVGGKLARQLQQDPVWFSFLQMRRDSGMLQLSLVVKNVEFCMKKCRAFYLI